MEHVAGAVPILPPGTLCNNQFLLEKMLSAGGFGQVFEARELYPMAGDTANRVVKVEALNAKFQMLHRECQCLRSLCMAHNPYNLVEYSPFLRYYGYGQIDGFRWLAMEKCGENLSDLKKNMPLNRFSVPTSLYILSKFISAIEMMHSIGWLHRDIKPANVCISLQNPRHLYLLDFGMSRIYVDGDGSLLPKRTSAPFRGTLRYVSVNIHKRRDASRWDDLWSAFYIATENMVGFLPWKRLGDAKLVEEKKVSADLAELKHGTDYCRPNSLHVMELHLNPTIHDEASFYQAPPYHTFIQEIAADLHLRGIPDLSKVPLDWMTVNYPPTHKYHVMKEGPFRQFERTLRTQKTPKKQSPQKKFERSVCCY